MRLSSPFVSAIFLLATTLSEVAIAQRNLQCNYSTDVDQDDDGLIELCDLDALDAIRYQLDGSGYRESFNAIKVIAGCPQSGCNGYELHNDLDFNSDDNYRDITNKNEWTNGLGWLPIGDRFNSFTARFEGNGHTIANLYINRPSNYIGLFEATAKRAKISNLVLSKINIKGKSYTGSLAGHNAGSVTYIGVEGGRLIGMGNNVGGLFGANIGTILNGDVMLEHVEGSGHSLGGLVGHNQGHISYSVTDTTLSGMSQVGGLIGLNSDGMLTNSRADGNVKGNDYIGGLVGLNRAHISASDVAGKVVGRGSYSGGLVGANHQGGRIIDSRASSSVSGNLYVGGLVGWNQQSKIINSFAVGRTDGNSDVGGLVGSNEDGQISNTYASGFMTGVDRVGGLVGSNKGIVSDSFANRRVVASGKHVGGLVGWNYAYQTRHAATVRVINSYWDSETSGILISAGGSLRTTTQLKSPTAPGLLGETFERWNVVDWEFGTSEQYPILKHSEGSNRRSLLPGQHIMLSGLLVLDGLTLSPAFNPQTFNYRVNLSDNSVSQIRFSPTIANSTQTISVLKDKETSLPSVRNGKTVSINLNVAPEPTLITIARHYQIRVIRQSGLQATISSDRLDRRVSEGQNIKFKASISEPDPWRVSHWWSQVSPAQPNLLEGSDLSLPEINIDIPDDFVSQDENETPVVLQVAVSAGGTTVAQTTTMTVVKENNGGLDTLAVPVYREGTLTVVDISETDLAMDPDGGVDVDSFSYQWQYKLLSNSVVWQDIEGAVQMRYQIPIALSTVNNISYRVELNYRDNQGNSHRIVSEPLSIMHVAQRNDITDIYYLEDLHAIRDQLDGKYELVRDLDFRSDASYRDPSNKAEWTVDNFDDPNDSGWLPIGDTFTGTFNGNGYTISALQINRDYTNNQGLFAASGADALISNIGLLSVKVEGGSASAGLVGTNSGKVIRSYVIGSIDSKSGNVTGGLVANNNSGDIIASYAITQVSGISSVGGLVGNNSGRVINSYTDSVVSALISNRSSFGGLVGFNGSLIANSHAIGTVSVGANNFSVGGLVGWNRGIITNSYATANADGTHVGGLVGSNSRRGGSIKNSYAIGAVQQSAGTAGGLVGGNGGEIVASYWNVDTATVRSRHGVGRSTTQLQSATPTMPPNSIYKDWDDDDWDFGTAQQYPILKHAPGSDNKACGLSGLPKCGDLILPGLRYGLHSLTLADNAIFSQPLDIAKLNHNGIYYITVINNTPSVRLIPVAMEASARISITGAIRETIGNNDISSPISLNENEAQKVIIEVGGTQTVRYTLYLSYTYHRAIDDDSDGLVDINYLEDLYAMRYQLDGGAYKAGARSLKITLGCPSEGCSGYELLRDLDFNDADSYRNADANMGRWTGLGAWRPILGTFTATFNGNNKTIANLRLRRSGGLFETIGSDSRVTHIDGIGLLGVDIKGYSVAGITTSCVQCTISNSYVIGNIEGIAAASGLVGTISASSGIARISNSYFIGNLIVEGQSAFSGGLVGDVGSDIIISDSYAVGRITAEYDDGFIGSLIGVRSSSSIEISNSYTSVLATEAGEEQGLFGGNRNPRDPLVPIAVESYIDQDISGTNVTLGRSAHTVDLQSPTSATDVYMRWGSDNLGNSDSWDFGTDKQYPAIKYNLRADFTTSDEHCATADMQKRPAACRTLLRHQGGLLQDLKLPEGAGSPDPFAFASFNYRMSLNADHSTVRLLPTAFNAIAVVEVFKDGNPIGATNSGEWTVPIPLNDDGDTVVALVVKEGSRRSYRYQFIVNRLNIVAENIDKDGDGLIDINNATHLNAIRRRLDGSAYQESETTDMIYCSDSCMGYELTADIDLAGVNWQSIGSLSEPFNSVLKGNGYTISNLTIRTDDINDVGLFTAIGTSGRIENVGLVNVDIAAEGTIGSIAAHNRGTIINSYAVGRVVDTRGTINVIGGLLGRNRRGTIVNSYAYVDIRAAAVFAFVGGLIGESQGGAVINSYATGNLRVDSGVVGGLVGTGGEERFVVDNSYAIGDLQVNDSGRVGGLVAAAVLPLQTFNNSYYRASAVISGTDSLVGTDKTAQELQAGVPSDDIYTGWDRADWNFGGAARYPALLYAVDNGNNATCTQPSPQQLSACNDGLFAGLSENDKRAVCLSHLPRLPEQKPYCGALLPEQRIGLVQLEFAENARLLPAFKPEIYEYDLIVDSSIETLRSTPTSYYGSDTITIYAGGLISATGSGQGLSFTLSDDLDSIVFEVQSATQGVPPYTINVLQDIAIVDGFIMIDYLEDLNLMRHSLTQVSAPFKDCPIDTQSNMRRCKGYKLARDLDFKDPTSYRAGDINPMWTDGAGWQPIGSFSNPFRDLFSGNAHTISHLRIHGIPTSDVGLFSDLASSARIENVGLLNVDIDTGNTSSLLSVGALVGWNSGEIVNSYVIGGEVRGFNYLGGLVGISRGDIVNSYTNVSVNGFTIVGGLVGSLGSFGLNVVLGSIHNSYASGTVVGRGEAAIGGLIGSAARPDIHNSYASGAVIGVDFSDIGGLIGQLSANNLSILNNSYATGELTGKLFRGGLIGRVSGELSGVINASYWDVDTSKASGSAGGVGKMTAELQTPAIGDGIYEDWDSDDWYSMVGQYPVLRYTSATDVLTRPACSAAEDIASEMPICGTLLPAQRISGLQSLALSNSIGQVLLLRPDFNPGIYDYELILRSDARLFSIIPNTFNRNARIVITDDSGTNERKTLLTGQTTSLFMDNINNFLMTLTVEDPPLLGTTITTIYRFAVSKHPLIAVNDIDEDDDGLIEIYHIEDLNTMRYQLDGSGYRISQDDTKIIEGCLDALCFGYELTRDLDFGDATSYRTGVVNSEWATNWQPIGDQSNPFNGVFDGNNHTISNLRIDRTNTDSVGLFVALADGAQVRNVNLEDVAVKGRFDVGSLAAYNAGEIDNSHADGTVIGERAVGGLVAHNIGSIFNSSAYGVVSGDPKNEVALIGGLVSRNENTGVIANSYSLSRVSGRNNIGGLVGLNLGSIANTYASGSVQGVTLIGGLVGENGGLVSDSYATADVVCMGVPACISYAVASGGLIGSNFGGIVVNSYWDIETSNIQGSAAGTGKTTLQLQSGNSQSSDASGVYYQWRDSDWYFGDAYQYPILKYTDNTESMLSGLQSYGLRSLAILEVVTLSPHFNTTKLYYRIGVDLDANIKHLHLIPKALDKDAIIRIASDSGFDETVASGNSSLPITLHSTTTTMISIEVLGERRVRYLFEVDYFSSGSERDIDTDKDGLIEILTLEDLDAMRNALDGRRFRHQNGDGVLIESARGCPITGCIGYELLQDLDFDNPAHYRAGRVNTAWTSGAGWQPIGTSLHPFTATFRGNGYTISNLTVNRPDSDSGLLGVIDGSQTNATVEGLGLIDVDIVGGAHVGGLVGYNRAGDISKSYVTGSVVARGNGTSAIVGGLIGRNVGGAIIESYSQTQVRGNLSDKLMTSLAGGLVALNDNRARIENSYATGSVIGSGSVGGLVALNQGSSEIINSYAVSRAIGITAMSEVGGLVARNDAAVADSYWDIEASGVALSAAGTSATTAILQTSTPTSPINSIYRDWDADVWEFTNANRYPTLKAIDNISLLTFEGESLLQSLTVSDTVRLFPSFHPLIFDYEIIAESGQMTEVQINTTATRVSTAIDVSCSDSLVCSSGLPLSFVLDGSHTPQITINTRAPDAGELSYHFSVRYVTSEIEQVSETITTTVSLPLTVAEGERVRLTASYNIGLNEDSYRYRWRQAEGDVLEFNDSLSPVDTQNVILDFTVPVDVVSAQDDNRSVQLILEIAVNDDVYLSKAVPLVVSKRNNDTASRVRLFRAGSFHTARFEREDGGAFIDRDGGLASAHLQWQRRRSDFDTWVDAGSGILYRIPEHGTYQYRVLATYEDNQGYRQQLASEAIHYLDIDDDGDGLIEIHYLEELDALRHQPDGSGYKATADAAVITQGCPSDGCKGYELMNDLDFNDDASYRTTDPAARSALKNSWTVSSFTDASDSSWQPIGDFDNPFSTVFNGNGYTISNMQINRSVGNLSSIGLFSELSSSARIENLGLVDPVIKGLVGIKNVGGIAGAIVRGSIIVNSYVTGDVASGNTDKIITGDARFADGRGFIGGLVGWNKGFILNSYAKINVVAEGSEMASDKRVGVGGLVGRNIDGGKVYNSYATGEVRGPCIVGGLVGNQFSTNSAELLKRSEIKNSYATGNVETGFGTCSDPNITIAGGLIGVNNNSRIENSYAIGKVSGNGALSGLVVSLLSVSSIANLINSYWNFDVNCEDKSTPLPGNPAASSVFCYGSAAPTILDGNVRLQKGLQTPTTPDVSAEVCVFNNSLRFNCKTYEKWSTADWDFGTDKQYPALKYGIGLDTDNPGCDEATDTELPSCDALLPGQVADTLLLDSLSLSFNSENVQLTPSFGANRFNYEATIANEVVPVVIRIAADATTNTAITIRKDSGAALTKQSDGSVQISASESFNIGVETAHGTGRGANYQIRVNLERTPLPLPDILIVINGAPPAELSKQSTLILNEGDVVHFVIRHSIIGQGLITRWSQVSGKLLSRSIPTVEFTVPIDFVAKDENDSAVVLKLNLSKDDNPVTAASREIPILVRKVNNGNSESAAKWINSDTLSAGDLLEDIDGGPVTDIAYQWLFEEDGEFVEISAANQRSFTPQKGFRDRQYRLATSYTDGQGYDTTVHYDAPLYANIATHKDKDNDGLIEIETLEDLNAIRYQLDGSGYRASSTATSKITAGCPADRCIGYELVRDLDFLDDASYSSISNKQTWTTGSGWRPIGFVGNTCLSSSEGCFNSIFEGNGYVISNLHININRSNYLGLFSENQGTIRNFGLSQIKVTGAAGVGGLAGRNFGNLINVYVNEGKVQGGSSTGLLTGISAINSLILNSYVHGDVSGTDRMGGICGNNLGNIRNSYAVVNVFAATNAGGLVGNSGGSIINSYATGSVSISDRGGHAGGIVGLLSDPGSVSNSYSTAEVKMISEIQSNNDVQYVGGLIGRRLSPSLVVANSYWDIDASKQVNSSGGGIAKTTAELQMPTAPGATANDIYYTWSPDRWDFGTFEEYPALRYPNNTCGTSTLSPDCSKLLLSQRIGLRDLKLEQNMGAGHLHLSPDFDPAVTTYTVSVAADASELKITPIATNPDAVIIADGKVLSAKDASYTILLNTSDPTSTVISVLASNSMGTEEPVVYKLTISNNRFPKISINAPALVAEGETFVLNAAIEDLEGDELSYALAITPDLFPNLEGSTGTIVGHADLTYELNIPSDLLAEMQSMDVMNIVMTVDDGFNIASEMTQLTIVKHNNGIVSVPAPMLNGFTYTLGDINLSSDSDGMNPLPKLAYQWQREFFGSWFDIDDATDASYTVEGIIGDRYRVLVDYTDKQSYRHRRVASPAVAAPQQFVYNVERSRSAVRTIMDRSTGIFVNVRVLLEGLLPYPK